MTTETTKPDPLAASKHTDETPAEYLRRVVHNLGHETESLLDDMPTIAALLEYFDLWAVYDTDYLSGILECIAEGDSPKPLQDFIDKYKLPWTIPAEILNEGMRKS